MTPPDKRPLDDRALAELVRDAVAGWELPPTRLDRTWRERVRPPRTRAVEALGGWLARLGRATGAGLVLTVVGALVAIALTGPRTPIASSGPSQTAPPTGRASQPPAAPSQLPKLLENAAVTFDPRLLVRADTDWSIADLSTGTLGPSLAATGWSSVVRRLADGTYLCLCVGIGESAGSQNVAKVSLVHLTPDGNESSRTVVASYSGDPDPRPGTPMETPLNVDVAVSFDPDGQRAYLGWTVRAHPSWRSGIDVVDLGKATVTGSIALPDRSDGEGDTRVIAFAPAIVGRAASGGLIVARGWYGWQPATSSNPSYTSASEAFVVPTTGSGFAAGVPIAGSADCGDAIMRGGSLPAGGLWLECARPGSQTIVVRRLDPAGRAIDDTEANVGLASDGTSVLSPDGTTLYAWDPSSFTVTRVDLATGLSRRAQAPRPTAAADPLRMLGEWLAPSVDAKVLLESGIAVSPDGRTIYALGIAGGPGQGDLSGSAGVFVFDAASMTFVTNWPAPADLVSVAISEDGRFVVAAGAPGVDASGSRVDQQASLFAFDATSGSVVVLAGQLGRTTLLLPETIVPTR